jgi:LysM repeat protein
VTLVADEPPAGPSEAVGRAGAAVGARLAPPPTYEVQRRDTLWDIAERHLGDPFRWPEIFALNQGKVQPDGRCLTDPDLIQSGWRLQLPDDAGGLAPQAPAASPAPPVPPAPPASPAPPVPPAPPAPPASPAPPVSAPDIARPTDDGGGMVLLDDGRDPAIVADGAGAGGPEAHDDGGGMVLLSDDGAQAPAPIPPPVPQPPAEQSAAGED